MFPFRFLNRVTVLESVYISLYGVLHLHELEYVKTKYEKHSQHDERSFKRGRRAVTAVCGLYTESA